MVVIILKKRVLDSFKGGLNENYGFNQLPVNRLGLYYWTSGSQAEVDFITRLGDDIIPIEVKAKINNRLKSLGIYTERYDPKHAIRVLQKNFGFENNTKSVPLYATFYIK